MYHQNSLQFYVVICVFYFDYIVLCFVSQKSFIESPTKPHLKCISKVVTSITFCLSVYLGSFPVCVSGTQQDSFVLRSDLNFTVQVPSENILRTAKIIRNAILSWAPHMIRDRKYHLKTYRLVSILIL